MSDSPEKTITCNNEDIEKNCDTKIFEPKIICPSLCKKIFEEIQFQKLLHQRETLPALGKQFSSNLHISSFLTALKMAAGGGLGSGGGNPFWSFIWFLGLIFVGWPIAGFCAGWYILLLPFGVCFDGFSVRFTFFNLSNYLSLTFQGNYCACVTKLKTN